MASLCTAAALPHSASTITRSLRPLRIKANEFTSASSLLSFYRLSKRQASANATVCFSIKPKNREEGEEEGSEDSLADALLSSVRVLNPLTLLFSLF